MKTLEDLNDLIPTLCRLVRDNRHNIGYIHPDCNEDGWYTNEESEQNYLTYDEDGWYIEIDYECAGDFDWDSKTFWEAHGEVTAIRPSWQDREAGEEVYFEEDEIGELWGALDEELKDIA